MEHLSVLPAEQPVYTKDIDLADAEKALLNILDDYADEKANSDKTQSALLNILDDFSAEKRNSDNTQTALLNILDDYRTEKENMEDTQRAFLNILEDYSDEKKKVETSNENLITANLENKELEQFAFVASHDLQEPLRTITNFVDLLAEKYASDADAETKEYIQYILSGTSKMQSLIRDLLELSRIGVSAVFAVVDLNRVMASVLADLDSAIKGCTANIVSAVLPVVTGNEMELKRLFLNLLSNAIKFRKKDIPLLVEISVIENKNDWLFSFKDNGIGIDAKYKEKIFIIFQRLHTVEEYPGTGIGLASCKKIISLHNGKISVESIPGNGANFLFTIAK